jgi:iron complex transport system permease protein
VTATLPHRVPGRPPVRLGPASGVWRARAVAVPAVGLALLVLAAAVGLGRGSYPLAVSAVLDVLAGGGTPAQRVVVWELRMPRVLVGVLVGAALGVSGALTQAVARNPLAGPDVLGVTAGAGAAAVAVIVLAGTAGAVAPAVAAVGVPLAALAGGLGAAVLVYGLAWRHGLDGYRLVLVGVAVDAAALAVTDWLLVRAQVAEAARATVWLVGSLNARGWEHVVPVAIALAVLVPPALLLAARVGVLQLGDDTARGLGLPLGATRALVVVLAVGLAAVATACAGPIAFVALVVPQIARRLVGSAGPPLLASAVGGALLMVVGDLVGRTLFPAELPVGIVTAVLGAPYLLWLLVHRRPAP